MKSPGPPEPAAVSATDPPGGAVTGVPVRGTALVAIGMTAAQILALSQMLVVSRALGPAEFGAFGSLAVVLLLGSTALVATQVVVARHEALGAADARHVATRGVLVVGAGTSLVAALASPLLAWVLNLPSLTGLLLIAAAFLPVTFTGAQLGLLQGREAHGRLGMLYLIATVFRVAGAIIGALIGATADATAAGILVGATLAALAGALFTRDRRAPHSQRAPARGMVWEIAHAGHALVALYALTNVDMLLARSQLDAHDAGLYAAGQLVSRAVFFLPQAILVAAFPRMVAQGRGRAQLQATAAVAGLGLLAVLVTATVPGLVLGVIAGSAYVEVTSSLWIFALAGAGFGVVQVLLYARLARHDRKAAILMWGGTAVMIALGVTVGDRGVATLAACAATVAWAVAVIGLFLDWRSAPPPGTEDVPPGEAMEPLAEI